MKKIIYIMIMFLFANLNANNIYKVRKTKAKSVSIIVLSPQELLKSKKWNIMGKSLDLYFEFTNTEQIVYIDGQKIPGTKYYISDTNCYNQPYDSSKLGQISSGRFLKDENGCCYITVINDTTIQLSYLSYTNPHTTTLIAKP